jgi:hypothetical protein
MLTSVECPSCNKQDISYSFLLRVGSAARFDCTQCAARLKVSATTAYFASLWISLAFPCGALLLLLMPKTNAAMFILSGVACGLVLVLPGAAIVLYAGRLQLAA